MLRDRNLEISQHERQPWLVLTVYFGLGKRSAISVTEDQVICKTWEWVHTLASKKCFPHFSVLGGIFGRGPETARQLRHRRRKQNRSDTESLRRNKSHKLILFQQLTNSAGWILVLTPKKPLSLARYYGPPIELYILWPKFDHVRELWVGVFGGGSIHRNINGFAQVKSVLADLMPKYVGYRAALGGVQLGFKLHDRIHAGIPRYILDNTDTNGKLG